MSSQLFRIPLMSFKFKPLSHFKPTLYTSKSIGISNIKDIQYTSSRCDQGEQLELEQEYISRKLQTNKRHRDFWAYNNEKFSREKEEFIAKLGGKVTSAQLSGFYRSYLSEQKLIMTQYNGELWKENFRNVILDFEYEMDVFARFLKYNIGMSKEKIKSWLWICFGAGLVTPVLLQA